MIIGLDFDGTVVQHAYPEIGAPLPNATLWIRRWIMAGARVILWTMRSGVYLEEAVRYLNAEGVYLYAINHNPDQDSWTTSPKAHCDLYVDDRGLGVPLVEPFDGKRAYVDWDIVGPMVFQMVQNS